MHRHAQRDRQGIYSMRMLLSFDWTPQAQPPVPLKATAIEIDNGLCWFWAVVFHCSSCCAGAYQVQHFRQPSLHDRRKPTIIKAQESW